ncbi:MAG: outer membrane lipoprotein-sorting protein [Candidatus Zixiibacteriota bacterium]
MKRYLLIAVGLLFVLALIAEEDNVKEIVNSVDRLYRAESSRGAMEMHIITPHWERTLVMNTWSKGKDKTFVRILEPKKEAGTATLRIGDKMWNYLPKTNQVVNVPPSMMMSDWMGSDFTNDDLVKESYMVDDYKYELFRPKDAEEGKLYIKLTPREDLPTVWGKMVLVVREDDYMPLRQEFYDEGGEKIRTMYFKDIQDMGGKTIPTTMELIPHNEEGNKTTVTYKDIEFDVSIDDDIFTLRNLKKGR